MEEALDRRLLLFDHAAFLDSAAFSGDVHFNALDQTEAHTIPGTQPEGVPTKRIKATAAT